MKKDAMDPACTLWVGEFSVVQESPSRWCLATHLVEGQDVCSWEGEEGIHTVRVRGVYAKSAAAVALYLSGWNLPVVLSPMVMVAMGSGHTLWKGAWQIGGEELLWRVQQDGNPTVVVTAHQASPWAAGRGGQPLLVGIETVRPAALIVDSLVIRPGKAQSVT